MDPKILTAVRPQHLMPCTSCPTRKHVVDHDRDRFGFQCVVDHDRKPVAGELCAVYRGDRCVEGTDGLPMVLRRVMHLETFYSRAPSANDSHMGPCKYMLTVVGPTHLPPCDECPDETDTVPQISALCLHDEGPAVSAGGWEGGRHTAKLGGQTPKWSNKTPKKFDSTTPGARL